jgi:hypothetical protein
MRTLPTFHLAAKSGLIAAATSANSVLFSWHNPSLTGVQYLHRLEVKARTVTGYTAEFENGLEARDAVAFDVDYTGGTDLSHPTTAANKAYTRISVDTHLKFHPESFLASGNVKIATTTGMTVAAPTIAAHPFLYDSFNELVAGAAVPKGVSNMVWEAPVVQGLRVPRALLPGNGFVIRNPVATAATGTLRFWVSVHWSEQP